MKKDIHPKYQEVIATCHCGAEFRIGSIEKEIRVDICSACHPVFQGKEGKTTRKSDVIDRFKQRSQNSEKIQADIKKREAKKAAEIAVLQEEKKSKKTSKLLGKTEV